MRPLAACLALLLSAAPTLAADKLAALIVDGQNNHKWQETTPVLRQVLEGSGRFTVDVVTSPLKGADLSGFRPHFSKYDVVVLNYNGDLWAEPARQDFERYVANGGGVVVFHAANNAFPEWKAYNEIIGLGGWGGRTEEHGPRLRFRDGGIVRDDSPGPGGHHGKRHEFVVTHRQPDHPILKGLPNEWRHAEDELYDSLRGPARQLDVLATAFSDPATGGTGEHEPVLMTIRYGKGRVFHTTLGHDTTALSSEAFRTVLNRGTEWAASGEVATAPTPPKAAEPKPADPKPPAQAGVGAASTAGV